MDKITSIQDTKTFITNPLTGRPVQRGGAVYRKLISEGTIVDEDKKDDFLYEIKHGDTPETIKQKKKELKKNCKINETIAKGIGRHKGKLVKKKKNTNLAFRDTAKITAKVLRENIHKLKGDNLEKEIEQLIINEIYGQKPTRTRTKRVEKIKKYEPEYATAGPTDFENETESESETE